MIVLGVNGWPDEGHDASACIIKDGELLVAAEEERFIRTKQAWNQYPHAASQYCLAHAGIELEEVDHIAFGWNLPLLYRARDRDWSRIGPALREGLFPKNMFRYSELPPIHWVNHHVAHAASAFWASGFEKAAVLIMDGQGELSSAVLGFASREGGIEIRNEIPAACSLGYLYKAASEFVGLGKLNPGKTMGLSSYGRVVRDDSYAKLNGTDYRIEGLDPEITPRESLFVDREVMDWWIERFERGSLSRTTARKISAPEASDWDYHHPDLMRYKNFAAWVQAEVERVALHLARELIRDTGCGSLVMAGGVALNCAMNAKIVQLPEVEELFIFPAAGDSGVAIGAALEVSFREGSTPNLGALKSASFGPEFSNDTVRDQLDTFGLGYQELAGEELHSRIARHLHDGKIVALFQGRSEIGPRALGNRSILASPDSAALRDKVNRAKGRELWRPLCPSVLDSGADDYFHDAAQGSYFMLRSLTAREDKAEEIEGVVHVDGTSRAQLVDPDTEYGKIISAFESLTGLPMVLNTSFNLAGEPMVGSPVDAIRSFYSSAMDVLVINDFVIEK